MKICQNCGYEVSDEITICPRCGSFVTEEDKNGYRNSGNTALQTIAKIIAVLGIVSVICFGVFCLLVTSLFENEDIVNAVSDSLSAEKMSFAEEITVADILEIYVLTFRFIAYVSFVSLLWCVPMTVYYFVATKKKKRIRIAFKICFLIFVNTISGILMLCDKN